MQYRNRDLIKDIVYFIKPYKLRFLVGTFCRASSDVLWLFVPWAMGEIVTFAAGYTKGASLAYFWKIIALLLGFALYHWIGHEIAKYIIYTLAERVSFDAQLKALKHIFSLDIAWHEKEGSGNKLKRISRGGESLNKIIRLYVEFLIESSINVVGISVVFYVLHWHLNALFIIFFVSYFFLSYNLTRRASAQARIVNVYEEEFEGYKFEAISNITTVKSLGIAQWMMKIIITIVDKTMIEIRRRVLRFRVRGFMMGLYEEIFRIGIVVYTTVQVFNGRFAVGTIALVLLYFNKIEEASSEFAETAHEFVIAKIAIMRMKDILNEEPKIDTRGVLPFNPEWKTLYLDHLRFSYHGRLVLNDLTLTINRGEKIGIVGISGAGKSTLFKLLLKLYDNYEGDIRFDDVPLSDIKRQLFIQHIAVVPQETELFNLPLKDNIALTSGEVDSKRLERAVEASHVKDFLHKLENGIDTMIGEKGVRLSGGERQRVGIARAVYKEPSILLLDEATSHLDTISERKIQEALHEFFRTTTAVVIAHRLSTLQQMDRIVVIKQGSVHEVGTFQELIERGGEFFELWSRQRF